MSPFGQLGNVNFSFLQTKQEAALALAHVNFDFSFVNYDAPIEFQGLGATLSKQRREEAEDGSIHITARKLGALFESILPAVGSLTQAYGYRVTEIAEMPSVNPKGSKSDGAFADLVGADGTTIWAAATSGQGVLAIHLLACMLARIWSRSEAVSIWEELVEQRKALLARELEKASTFPESLLRASRVVIGRDQLASWDAGARAWIRTTDEAKKLQQTQLKLVIDNVSLSVSEQADVYSSVTKTWIDALIAINKIVESQPQRIQDGGILLALSSWHLYPDMFVFAKESHRIIQNDTLIVQGGMISLGLQNNRDNANDGVWWSLPWAHMRYYGEPIVSTRNTGISNAHVTFDQFLLVALGSVLSTWNVPEQNFEPALTVIMHLGGSHASSDSGPSRGNGRRKANWLQALSRVSHAFMSLSTGDRKEHRSLIAFGMRRSSKLMGESHRGLCPVFGLTNIQLVLRTILKKEDKIQLLRYWATSCKRNLDGAVIRYSADGPWSIFIFTNVFPLEQPFWPRRKRKRHSMEILRSGTYRTWTESTQDRFDPLHTDSLETAQSPAREYSPCRTPTCQTMCSMKEYELVFGNPTDIAIFRPRPMKMEERSKRVCDHIELPHLLHLADIGLIEYSRLADALLEVVPLRKDMDDYFDCLDDLYQADTLYTRLPHARINLQVTSRALNTWSWAASLDRVDDRPDSLSLACCLSCIASFEAGYLDLHPEKLQEVFAVSHENSIYVASPLLSDPSEDLPPYPVRRSIENIGEPGLAVLVAPQKPKIRSLGFDEWNLIAHRPFEGHLEDNFAATSLHLAMTGYKLPLNTGTHGSRDHEAIFVESVSTVYDRGDWVANLDVMKAYRRWKESNGNTNKRCMHSEVERQNASVFPSLACIDTWVELLDRPSGYTLVQARGNQLARLAAATVATEKD